MKNFIKIWLLAILPLFVQAQKATGTFEVDLSGTATKAQLDAVNSRIDNLEKLIVKPPVVVPPVINPPSAILPNCDGGPNLEKLLSISPTQIRFLFDGSNVTLISAKYTSLTDTAAIQRTLVTPSNNNPIAKFNTIANGTYRFWIQGGNCKNKKDPVPINFTIGSTGEVTPPIISPVVPSADKIYELVLNLTGEGFEATYWRNNKWNENTVGFKDSDYVEKFKVNGKYTITSVRVAFPWYEFEKTPGNYEIEGVKRMIQWHRDRGLILHICFLPWRKYGDGFISNDLFMRGNRGGTFYPVDIREYIPYNSTIATYVDDQTNARIKKAVQVLSEVLSTYEKAGYIGLGSGRGEEFVMPNFETVIREKTETDPGYKIVEASDLSDPFMAKFKEWVEKRKLTAYRRPDFYSENGYLDATNEIGKEYMRFCTYTMRKYFDNFAEGVRAGSSKINVCFFMPSVGTHQNGNELIAYFSYVAKNADELYHSDGSYAYDNERKIKGIKVFRGTFPNKPASAEIDSQDAGQQEGWGTGEVTTSQFVELATKIWEAGGWKTHIAMKYLDNGVQKINEGASRLRQYTGKPFNPPPVTVQNTVIVDITKSPHNVFNNEWLYDQTFNDHPDAYINQIETPDFWGGVNPDVAALNPNPPTYFDMPGGNIQQKGISIFLPNAYTTAKKYPVVYWTDGQDLFNDGPGKWNLNATAQNLINSGQIKETIIVGINSDQYRFREYLPSATWVSLDQSTKDIFVKETGGNPLGDEFLKFLVTELKPKIDSEYSTLSDQQNTFIGGSSMGGLIGIYALCKYPDIFKGNISMSTHWMGSLGYHNTDWFPKFKDYLTANLPDPTSHKLYFDHGTVGLDDSYTGRQNEVDAILKAKGYSDSNFRSLVIQGGDHAPLFWSARVDNPLKFQIGL